MHSPVPRHPRPYDNTVMMPQENPSADVTTARTTPTHRFSGPAFAALDLGTNNCRMLVGAPSGDGFRVLDSFSRIVRLGEGLHHTGALSQPTPLGGGVLERSRDRVDAAGGPGLQPDRRGAAAGPALNATQITQVSIGNSSRNIRPETFRPILRFIVILGSIIFDY